MAGSEKTEYTFAPGVTSQLDKATVGQFQADIMAVLKSYGFTATMDADNQFDEIKRELK